MPGETDVANVALRLIGSEAISGFADGSDTANKVNDIYEEVRDDLLRSHPWNFATKRQKLAQSSTAPAFEFDYAYPLPADWLRTISVHDNDGGYSTILYRVELIGTQRAIVTSSEDVYLRYVARVTDPNLMHADFRRALELALARDLAVSIAASNKLQDQLSKQFDRKIGQARSSDAIGASPEMRPRGSWANSRGGWRRNDWLSND